MTDIQGEGQRHPFVAYARTWDEVVEHLFGESATLVSVSRWVPDSRVYKVGNLVAKIRKQADGEKHHHAGSLRRECDLWRSLGADSHFSEYRGFEVLTVPLVSGTPVSSLGSTTIAMRVAILRGLFTSLRELHSKGIAHRDLRQDNVLLDGCDVRLVDFDRGIRSNRVLAPLYDYVGWPGRSPSPYWRFGLTLLIPKAETLARRLRESIRSRRRRAAGTSSVSGGAAVSGLPAAWSVAAGSNANAPGQGLAYYSFSNDGENLTGERPWYLRWEHIRKSVDFRGKSVLELGCNMGMLSTFSLLYGARDTLGVDRDESVIFAARMIAEAVGVEARFETLDLSGTERWEHRLEGRDLVVAMSLLHWLDGATRERVRAFLGEHSELIYEGHDPIEVELDQLKSLGFETVHVLTTTERGRTLFHASKK